MKYKIALDFDNTYTSQPQLWAGFVKAALALGIEIKIVTYRYPSESHYVSMVGEQLGIDVIYTSRQPKKDFYDADVWIDDEPMTILHDIDFIVASMRSDTTD